MADVWVELSVGQKGVRTVDSSDETLAVYSVDWTDMLDWRLVDSSDCKSTR